MQSTCVLKSASQATPHSSGTPAVGRAVAEEILGESPSIDLTPYRLSRFDDGADFPETLVL